MIKLLYFKSIKAAIITTVLFTFIFALLSQFVYIKTQTQTELFSSYSSNCTHPCASKKDNDTKTSTFTCYESLCCNVAVLPVEEITIIPINLVALNTFNTENFSILDGFFLIFKPPKI